MSTEDQIAQQLADTLPHSEPISTAYPEDRPAGDPGENFVDKMLPEEKFTQSQLLDYLQIPTAERHSPVIENYINTIYAWARDTAGSGDIDQLIRVISEQEMHMGIKLRPDKAMRLAEYIKISKIRQQLSVRERNLYG